MRRGRTGCSRPGGSSALCYAAAPAPLRVLTAGWLTSLCVSRVAAGIATVEGLMYATTKELGAIKGISEQKVTKLKEIGGCCGSWVLGAWHCCSPSGACCPRLMWPSLGAAIF